MFKFISETKNNLRRNKYKKEIKKIDSLYTKLKEIKTSDDIQKEFRDTQMKILENNYDAIINLEDFYECFKNELEVPKGSPFNSKGSGGTFCHLLIQLDDKLYIEYEIDDILKLYDLSLSLKTGAGWILQEKLDNKSKIIIDNIINHMIPEEYQEKIFKIIRVYTTYPGQLKNLIPYLRFFREIASRHDFELGDKFKIDIKSDNLPGIVIRNAQYKLSEIVFRNVEVIDPYQ